MSTIYYIDGYNIMHRAESLRAAARADLEHAREQLIGRVAQFCIAIEARAVLVFDGRGDNKVKHASAPPGVRGLQIVYTPMDLTADSYIEREVYKQPDRLKVAVVSNDRSLRDLCRNLGALTMDADNFLATMRESRGEVTAVMQKGKQQPISHLEDALDDDVRQKLMELRKKL
jgi:predicted RNA-binding protein with PIN domain